MSNRIEIVHGAGARESWELLTKLIIDRVPLNLRRTEGGFGLDVLDDGAVLKLGSEYLVITVDSYTVNPIFFPGGSIGSLAASGTINDLVVMGARPIAMLDSIVVEEGMDLDVLQRIVDDMLEILKKYNIPLIGGDFKVMPRGSVDKIVITMVGIGIAKNPIIDIELKSGDKIVVTGPVAEHGATILAAQLGMLSETKELYSDTKPLIDLLMPIIERYRECIHAARDPTRGGLAAILNEWARATGKTIVIERSKTPVRQQVKRFLDALGIDFLTVASEGIAVLAVDSKCADTIVEELRSRGAVEASVIGEVIEPSTELLRGKVLAITEIGGKIIVEPKALALPRIC